MNTNTTNADIHNAAAALGRMGGASTSPAKRAASRANGAKGGRPKTTEEDCFLAGHRDAGKARGYYADGRFRVSEREAARLCRSWGIVRDNISELYVYGEDGKRVPVWTR